MYFRIFILLVFVIVFQGISAQSCDVEGIIHSRFSDIVNVLDKNNCAACHKDGNNLGGWNYDTYAQFVQSGNCSTDLIYFGDASMSEFYKIITSQSPCISNDEGAHFLPMDDVFLIEKWINAGAPEFCIPLYQDVVEILDAYQCMDCHKTNEDTWRYDSYENMISKGLDDNCVSIDNVSPGHAGQSLLYDKINNDGEVICGEPMGGPSGPMDDQDVATIRDWINSNAPQSLSTLPVELVEFEVSAGPTNVRLSWKTLTEVGTSHFLIQRRDKLGNFEQLAEIDANGGIGAYDYTFVDDHPEIGKNFYRLKVVDFDGSYNYSIIRSVYFKSEKDIFRIYPNPIHTGQRLKITWVPKISRTSAYLNIINIKGQIVSRKVIFEGTNYSHLPKLPSGLYTVSIADHFGGRLLRRLVIMD